MKSQTISRCNGFMLMEMVVILALLSMVLAMGIYFNLDDFRSYSYRQDRDLLISILHRARSQAQNGLCHTPLCDKAVPYGVYIEDDSFTIFEGDNFLDSDTEYHQTFEANPNTLYGGMREIVFEEYTGNTLGTGTITLTSPTGLISTIAIGQEGLISWTY